MQDVEAVKANLDEAAVEQARVISLKEIQSIVADELTVFKQYFRESMRTPVGLLDKVTQYVLRQKGKKIRPTLVLLSAKVCGGVTEVSYRAAALVELLHTATLVHDDVVDEAERRREEIDAALGEELSAHATAEGIVMASSSWKISARNPG